MSGIFNSPASMCVMLAGVEGEITASHLSMFSVRPCDVANSLTILIWSWQSEMFVDRVRMSSAWAKAPRWRPQTVGPHDLFLSSWSSGSNTSRKRSGESTEPWQTPLLTVKEGEVALPRRTYEWTLVYQSLMRHQVFPVMPAFLR